MTSITRRGLAATFGLAFALPLAAASTAGAATTTPTATALSIHAKYKTVTAANKFLEVISGRLTAGTVQLAKQPVVLWERPTGATTWTVVATKHTSKTGAVSFTLTQTTASEQYAVHYAGNAVYAPATSAVLTILKA
jgi:hypothetical protein